MSGKEKPETCWHQRKTAPVQGFVQGIPWEMHLRAYDAYCKRWRKQEALITGWCRGGFHVNELDELIPGWREELTQIAELEAVNARLRAEVAELRAVIHRAHVGFSLVTRWAAHAHNHWEADNDSKVGKCLLALYDGLNGYAPDTDIIHSIIDEVVSADKAAAAAKEPAP